MFGFFKKALGIKSEQKVVYRKEVGKEELEELLLEADVNYELIETILEQLPQSVNKVQLYNSFASIFDYKANWIEHTSKSLFIEMIIGVNGAGKTTTIAKLANLYKSQGRSVMLGAADTFRAAAIEQLSRWAASLNVPIIATKQGYDPSAVVFDTVNSAIAKGVDNVLIDTAGRLHTQVNLSEELKKMVRVANKALEGAPHRKLLVLDGTQGSATISQVKAFDAMIGIDGIIITKLDGTAKGGAILTIAHELKMPIYYVGIGEKAEDLMRFDTKWYLNSIVDEIFTKRD